MAVSQPGKAGQKIQPFPGKTLSNPRISLHEYSTNMATKCVHFKCCVRAPHIPIFVASSCANNSENVEKEHMCTKDLK